MSHLRQGYLGALGCSLLLAVAACGSDDASPDGTGGSSIGGSSGAAGAAAGAAGAAAGAAGAAAGGNGGSAGQPDCSSCSAVHAPSWERDHQPTSAIVGQTLGIAQSGAVLLFDLADPDNLSQLGTVAIDGDPRALYARDQVLLAVFEPSVAGTTTPAVYAIDVSDPTQPAIAATVTLPGAWEGYGESLTDDTGMEIRGFASAYNGTTFWTLDVSEPSVPTVSHSLTFSHRLPAYFRGSWGFARDDDAMRMFDPLAALDPTTVVSIAGYSLRDPEVEGADLRVHDGATVYTWDVSDPTHPVERGQVEMPLDCAERFMSHRYEGTVGVGLIARDVLVSESSGGMCDGLGTRWPNRLVGLDVSEPSSPRVGMEYDLPIAVTNAILLPTGVLLFGNEPGKADGAMLIDTTDPDALEVKGMVSVGQGDASYGAGSVKVLSSIDLALFSAGDGTTVLADISDNELTERGSITIDGEVLDAYVIDGHLALVTHWEVAIFDIADRDAPTLSSRATVMAH